MINPFKEIQWRPGKAELRQFGWSLIIGFPCLALAFFLIGWLSGGAVPSARPFLYLAAGGMAAGILAILIPPLSRPLYLVWYAFAACIGLVISNLVMVLLYYGLFTPIGLVRRWSGADPLRLRRDTEAPTHWIDLPAPPPPDSYFRQF